MIDSDLNLNNTEKKATENKSWVLLFVAMYLALIVDGMDLQLLNLCLPVLRKEFEVSQIQTGAITSYTLIGMGIGNLISGLLADRIGRVKVTILSLVTFSLTTAFLGFTHSYWQFVFIRFLSGIGIAALFSIGTLLVAEYVPTKKRGIILGALITAWSIGYIAAALLSSAVLPVYGWRPLFILSIIPAAVSFVILLRIKEPASYALAKEKKVNTKKQNEYMLIWRNKPVRKTFLLWAVTTMALQFGYYGANTWVPSYMVTDLGMDLKKMSLYVAGTYTAMIFGKILAGYLADKFGRRIVWLIGGLVTAVAIPAVVSYANKSNVIYLMTIFGFVYALNYSLLAAYTSESYPVEVRGTCVATTGAIGRIGSVLSPIFVGYMATHYSIGYGIALLGVAYAICALIPGLFIKENAYDPSGIENMELPKSKVPYSPLN